MAAYIPPLEDMRFALGELIHLESILALRPELDLSADVVHTVLDEAGKFAAGVFAPADRDGDLHGCRWVDGDVFTPPGYREAYDQFVESGWHSLSCRPEFGGQGFPRTVSALVDEMWRSANLALTGCGVLTRGAIEALELRASDALKAQFLPAMISGKWTGSMNLTEPQAGSDLSAIRSSAQPAADGTYRVHGQKIFISWGQHDLGDNIVHLVLARTPDAPPGVKGISMFLVPQKLVNQDGTIGVHNDVHCVSIERKAGQHGSPSTMLVYGENGVQGYGESGAVGFLVGDLNRGLEVMFIMMNEARFAVGLEGLAVSDRAYQAASSYAKERVQGTEQGGSPGVKVPIIRHPDVRRMLMRMKSATEGMRALAVVIAAAIDQSHGALDAGSREQARAFVDFMTPIFKAWNTETAVELTGLGVQIHGGLGFMEECAASQYWKDSRIMTIYEGTTAIQANDLVGRKIARDGGAAARGVIASIQKSANDLRAAEGLASIANALEGAAQACERCVKFVLAGYEHSPAEVLAVAVPILEIFGITSIGWQLGRSALAATQGLEGGRNDPDFLQAKIATSRFFAEHWMPAIAGLLPELSHGGGSVLALTDEQL